MHIYSFSIGSAANVVAPQILENFSARENVAGPVCQKLNQPEFYFGQAKLMTPSIGFSSDGVDGELAHPDNLTAR